MKAVLLAAGLGTRLRPITDKIPKCLVPINGRPLLDYWLKMLDNCEIDEIIVNAHFLHEEVRKYLQDSLYAKKVTLFYEPELLGTAGTLRKNIPRLGNDSFLVIHADNFSVFSVEDFISAHKKRPTNCVLTMMTFASSDPKSCGVVQLDGCGRVVDFFEKVDNPPSNLANAAVYIFEKPVLDFIDTLPNRYIDISLDVIPHFIGQIYSFHNATYHMDIGQIERYRQVEKDVIGLKQQFHL